MKTLFHIHSAHCSDIVADPAVGQAGRNPAPHHHYKITTNEAFFRPVRFDQGDTFKLKPEKPVRRPTVPLG